MLFLLRVDAVIACDQLDDKTGASLKLTVLNPEGRVLTMVAAPAAHPCTSPDCVQVAGGGASVIYADTLSDLGQLCR